MNGLASENERWGVEIERLKGSQETLIGDCMLAAGFVSYVGAFDQQNRQLLYMNQWIPDLTNLGVPMTPDIDPLSQLTNDGNNAQMISEGEANLI